MAVRSERSGEPRFAKKSRGSFLAPFRYRDFSLLWTGMFVGNLGTWMQFTALGYYVAKLAPNAGLGFVLHRLARRVADGPGADRLAGRGRARRPLLAPADLCSARTS